MNLYIVTEGECSEPIVYPKWISLLAPHMSQVKNIADIRENNYYLFASKGIPSIFHHIVNALKDINNFNENNKSKIDYLIVFIDTEEEDRDYIVSKIDEAVSNEPELYFSCKLKVFEQKVSIETWFLGHEKMLNETTDSSPLRDYIIHYNVRRQDPELMENYDPEKFSTKAQFHHYYVKKMFQDRGLVYRKNNPGNVCENHYLNALIDRYNSTGHIASFGRMLDFLSKL